MKDNNSAISPKDNLQSRTTRVDEGLSSTTIHQSNPATTVHEGEPKKTTKVNEKPDPLKMLTPEEQQQLAASEEKEATAKREDTDIDRPADQEGKLFEEGDIIDWMFRHIIVAGMNSAGNVAVKWTTYGSAWVVDKTLDGIENEVKREYQDAKDAYKWLRSGGKRPENETTKLFDKVGKMHEDSLNGIQENILNDKNQRLLEGVAGFIRRGELEKLHCFSDETLNAFKSVPPEILTQRFSAQNMQVVANNMLHNIAASEQYAANMAATMIMEERIKDKAKPGKDKEANLFEEYKAAAKADYQTYFKEMTVQGKNPYEEANNLVALSEKALANTKKTIEQGDYNELFVQYGTKAKIPTNSELQEINTLMDGYKNSPYRDQTEINDFAAEVINNKEKMTLMQKEINLRDAALSTRAINRDERRNKFNKIVANVNNPLRQGVINLKTTGAEKISGYYNRAQGGYSK